MLLTNYRSVVFNEAMSSTTKTDIIISLLNLGEEKGLANVSLSDLAIAVGIKKASIYSHFESHQAIIDCAISYCQEILAKKVRLVDSRLDFKAKDVQSFLYSLLDSLLETFAEEPLCSFLSISVQQRMFSELFNEQYRKIRSMVITRSRVALEFCVQKSWLFIRDTDAAADLMAAQIMDILLEVILQDRKKPSQSNTDWDLDNLVDGLIALFS